MAIDFARVDPSILREQLREIIASADQRAVAEAAKGRIELKRGHCTIPLPGIDVPFHSRVLGGGVPEFHAFLSKRVGEIDPDVLIGKYIPNLVAKPFQLTKEYAELILTATDSPRLAKMLQNWERDGWGKPERRQRLAKELLLLLLSHQFASPVRWIETQDVIFNEPYAFERFIEFGPSPTLKGMAQKTAMLKYAKRDQAKGKRRAMFCHSGDKDAIYYAFQDAEAAAPAVDPSSVAGPSSAPAAAAAPVAAAPVATPAPSAAAAAEVPDEPVKAVDTLRAILAQKLKKSFAEIPLSKAIKDLVGGKSTLQNELIASLSEEFSSLPERGEELPLEELGAGLQAGYSGTLGKYTSGLVSRMVGGKLPGGFNLTTAKAHLSKTWGLGAGRTDSVLLIALTQEPAKRLGSEPEAKAFLDAAASTYAQHAGITLSSSAAGGGGGGGGGGATISSEELDKLQARHDEHARRQIQILERYIGVDGRAGARAAESVQEELKTAQAQLDAIAREHGEEYTNLIKPRFDALKARHFASYWNWSRQDAQFLWYDILAGRLTTVDREITQRCLTLLSRADEELIELMAYTINKVDPSRGPTYALAKEFGQMLLDNCREAMALPPTYKEVYAPTAPYTEITTKGEIVYREVKREGVRKLEAYVQEMAAGTRVGPQVNIENAREQMAKLWTLIRNEPSFSKVGKTTIKNMYSEVVRSLGPSRSLRPAQRTATRTRRTSSTVRPTLPEPLSLAEDRVPYLNIRRKVGGEWQASQQLTGVYMTLLEDIAKNGITFQGQNALLTGVGKGSIALEVAKGLLAGGARVVITTSSYSRATLDYYKTIFQKVGARGSTLTVVPYNAASREDTQNLVSYIYDTLKMDLDILIPFAAIPAYGRDITAIDDRSEVSFRAMLTNVHRLIGAIVAVKRARKITSRPTQALLPLSPNHGNFGGDGLYSESKIALETLSNRSISEQWNQEVVITGAIIGWVRGTGLMDGNNTIAANLEQKHGLRTFTSVEMSFNLLGCLHPLMVATAQVEPIVADLGGGFSRVPDLAAKTVSIRAAITDEAARRRAIAIENAAEFAIVKGAAAEALHQTVRVQPRALHDFAFPAIPDADMISKIAARHDDIDLKRTVVVVGFGEVGPLGSSRTRWERECGAFSIQGCIELAWMMGMIRFVNGKLKNGKAYVGWVDAKSEEPLADAEIKTKYEDDILKHTGIRVVEPELFRGYDPARKGFKQEIELLHDLEPLEVSQEEADKYKREHGDKVDTWDAPTGGVAVQFKKGARIFVPQAIAFSRSVAGQLPTGWDPKRYGIPEDICANVDRTALWTLVAVTEALVSAGITDPYELYKFTHISKVGTAIGSGMGGMESLSKMFNDRTHNLDVQKDILQETFINTISAWTQLLLMSSSGPTLTPVGACATALQSVSIACEAIKAGKADVMLAGGVDDYSEEGAYEFANMGATVSSVDEIAKGREPSEASRPTTSSRAGFLESQGVGAQVLMSAEMALRMGCPIQAVVAYTSTHTDKQGRSVPAPGHGVMSAAEPLKQALAEWGLNGDSVGAISIHGTSTNANDKNESHVYQELFKHLGRTPSHSVPVMAQKWIVGHAKGGAAAWALNGLIQSTLSATVPGNRNADDISPELRKYTYLLYASQTLQRTHEDHNVGLVTSFGFGQVGGIAAILHPAHLLARVAPAEIAAYAKRRAPREAKTHARMHAMLVSNSLVRVKEVPPYSDDLQDDVMLNVNARVQEVGDTYAFVRPLAPSPPAIAAAVPVDAPAAAASGAKSEMETSTMSALTSSLGNVAGVGIDVQTISGFPTGDSFIKRNFTDAEVAYCDAQPDRIAALARRWAAKEALVKALSVPGKGAAAPLVDIEVLSNPEGPTFRFHGDVAEIVKGLNAKFLLSISQSGDSAVAIVHRIAA